MERSDIVLESFVQREQWGVGFRVNRTWSNASSPEVKLDITHDRSPRQMRSGLRQVTCKQETHEHIPRQGILGHFGSESVGFRLVGGIQDRVPDEILRNYKVAQSRPSRILL